MPLAGKPLIIRMLERVSNANLSGIIVAALTKEHYDDELADFLIKTWVQYIPRKH